MRVPGHGSVVTAMNVPRSPDFAPSVPKRADDPRAVRSLSSLVWLVFPGRQAWDRILSKWLRIDQTIGFEPRASKRPICCSLN